MYRNTYVEIDVNRIQNNIKNILKRDNSYQYYIGVVKGNAYGHGFDICKYLIDSGINYLAVSTLDEALEIRKRLKKIPILILQPVNISYINICEKENISITISSYEYYKELMKKEIKNLKVHLKLDTGMNRLGIQKEADVKKIYDSLINSKTIILEGIYTHLATTGIMDNRFDSQIERFKELTKNIDLSKIKIVHLYSSNAFIIHPKLPFANGVRLGIIMYGLAPRNLNNIGFKNKLRQMKRDWTRKHLMISPINDDFTIDVKPAFTLVSEVSEIKEVDENQYIGYGNNYLTNTKELIAIIPVGYMDGLSLNNKGRSVYINNKKYSIVGVINMGMITVKVDKEVHIGDRVEVIKDIRSESSYAKTTPHQYMTSISPLLERKYIEGEE